MKLYAVLGRGPDGTGSMQATGLWNLLARGILPTYPGVNLSCLNIIVTGCHLPTKTHVQLYHTAEPLHKQCGMSATQSNWVSGTVPKRHYVLLTPYQ